MPYQLNGGNLEISNSSSYIYNNLQQTLVLTCPELQSTEAAGKCPTKQTAADCCQNTTREKYGSTTRIMHTAVENSL